MATITSTPTGNTLTANKNKQVTGTISWSKPTIPSGATISSCVLTGKATATMSKGSVTITVNGTTVTSGSTFTINLGTDNNTTSVTTSIKGTNNQASGSVSFSELLYTVTYTEPVAKPTYTVTFKDWDGTVLKTQTVEEGNTATAPSNPTREGYDFTGWDKSITNITSNLTVTAQYSIKTYTVTFKDWDGTTLKTQTVNHGNSATAPSNPVREGYDFTGWDKSITNITSDLTITAQYSKLVITEEWSGLGTIATGLKAHSNGEDYIHNSYNINLDWNNESFDIIITGELNRDDNYAVHPAVISDIIIGEENYVTIWFYGGDLEITNYDYSAIYSHSVDLEFPYTISFTKNGIYVKSTNMDSPILVPESENIYEINQSISFIDDRANNGTLMYAAAMENPNYNLIFDLAVSELPEEEPEVPTIPVDYSIALRPVDATEDSSYNNKWTNIQNVMDSDTSTYGTLVITGTSQTGFKKDTVTTIFNIDKSAIPANATIKMARLSIRSKSSATTNLYMTVDVNNDPNKRVITDSLMGSTSTTNAITDVTYYYDDLETIALTYRTAGTSNRTVTVYDISIDVDYTVEEPMMLVARYTAKSSGCLPVFNNDFTFTSNETVSNNVYTVEIFSNDDFSSISFQNNRELTTIEYLKVTDKVTTFTDNEFGSFDNCTALTYVNTDGWDVSNVMGISYMFYGCVGLTQANITNLKFDKLIHMKQVFYNCNKLTHLDLSKWNVSNIDDIDGLFMYCNSLDLVNLNGWTISKDYNIYSLFLDCNNLTKVFMKDSDYESVNKIISQLPTRSVDNVGYLDISGVDNISQVDVTTANNKYWNVVNINADRLVAKYTSKVPSHLPTFNNGYEYSVIETESNGVYTVEIYSENDFESCSFYNNFSTQLLTVDYLKITNKVTAFNVGYYGMFDTCSNLTYVNTEGWDTSNVTNMNYLFYNCQNLTNVNVSDLNVSKVTSMQQIFYNCNKLTQLDLSKWDVSKVTSMNSLFNYCGSLTSLNLDEWDMTAVTNYQYIFGNCPSLASITIKNTDYGTVNKIASSLPTRTADSMGVLDVSGIDDISQVNEASINFKYWNLVNIADMGDLIARYTSLSSSVFPTFNAGFNYTTKVIEPNVDDINYTIELYSKEDFVSCTFKNQTPLVSVDYLKVTNNVTAFSENDYGMFDSCTNLKYVNTEGWDTSNVTNMSYMFYNCQYLNDVNVNNFNTSKVTTMKYMFYYCNGLKNMDFSNLDTNKVTDMSGLFYYSSLESLNINCDLSNVTNVSSIFYACSNLKEVTCNVNTLSKIQSQLPTRSAGNEGTVICDDLGDFNTSTLKAKYWNVLTNSEPKQLIAEYKFDNTIANFTPVFNEGFTYIYEDVVDGNVTTRTIYSDSLPTLMRFGTNTLYADDYVKGPEVALISIEYLDTSNLTTCSNMFKRCTSLVSINTDGWNTSNVTTMQSMFGYCYSLTSVSNLSNWDTSNVNTMNTMFYGCESLTTLDLSGWNTSKVEDMQCMFGFYDHEEDTMALTSIIGLENWDTSNVTNMEGMFCHCRNLTTLDVSNFDTGNVIDMGHMFASCKSLTSLEVSNWNTGNVTNMVNMFDLCSRLVLLDVSNWNVSKVQNMGAMFGTCSALKELNVSDWKTDSLTKANWMFNKCLNLQELDLSSWNVNNVTNMVYALSDCESLKQLNLSNWNLNNADVTGIFSAYSYSGCSNLNNISMNNSDYNSVNKIIEQLPTRSENETLTQINVAAASAKYWKLTTNRGILDITGVDDISKVNIADAKAKYWDIIPDVQIENPEVPEIPVDYTIALRPVSATEDSGYNNKWSNIANVYDTDTTTSGTIIVTGSSQTGYKRNYVDTVFNFENPIPADAIITKAVLTVRAKQSATTNLYISVDINGDSSKRVINDVLLGQSASNYTADIADIVKDLNTLNLNLRSAATSNRTFTAYDIRVDVEYTVYEKQGLTDFEKSAIEWSGIGTVVENATTTDIVPTPWIYKLNMDWDNQYLELDIKPGFDLGNLFKIWTPYNDINYYNTMLDATDVCLVTTHFSTLGILTSDEFDASNEFKIIYNKSKGIEIIQNGFVLYTYTNINISEFNDSQLFVSSADKNGSNTNATGTSISIYVRDINPPEDDNDKEFVNAFNIGGDKLQKMFIGGDDIIKIYMGEHLIYGYRD